MGIVMVGVDPALANAVGVRGARVMTGAETLALLARRTCDAIVVGAHVLDMRAEVLIGAVAARHPDTPVVRVGSADAPGCAAVWEHVPAQRDRLASAIDRAAEVGRLRRALAGGGAGGAHDDRVDEVFRSGSIRDMERLMILRRLARLDQNRTRSASSLEISVRTLRNKLRRYRAAPPPGPRPPEDY
jgi:DNA-binding NtrC family response regulator